MVILEAEVDRLEDFLVTSQQKYTDAKISEAMVNKSIQTQKSQRQWSTFFFLCFVIKTGQNRPTINFNLVNYLS